MRVIAAVAVPAERNDVIGVHYRAVMNTTDDMRRLQVVWRAAVPALALAVYLRPGVLPVAALRHYSSSLVFVITSLRVTPNSPPQ